MQDRRLASRRGRHGTGPTSTSTLPLGRHADEAEAEQAAELAHARIVLATATATASRGTHRKPDLVTRSGAVHGLQDEIEGEGQFQLPDHDGGGLLAVERDQVAAAHFAFDLEAELLEEALDRRIKGRFQGVSPAQTETICA